MTTLKDINFGLNQYCGPAVLSALTGESTDRCAAVISAVSGKKEVRAVERAHLIEALKRLQFNVEETSFQSPTLFGTLHKIHSSPGIYVIFVPHHVVAVEVSSSEIFICDNHSKQPLDIKQSARLTQRVERVVKVVAKDPPRFLRSEIRLSRTIFRMDIYNSNIYESIEDNNEYHLGYIKFRDEKELTDVLYKLHCLYESEY